MNVQSITMELTSGKTAVITFVEQPPEGPRSWDFEGTHLELLCEIAKDRNEGHECHTVYENFSDSGFTKNESRHWSIWRGL